MFIINKIQLFTQLYYTYLQLIKIRKNSIKGNKILGKNLGIFLQYQI